MLHYTAELQIGFTVHDAHTGRKHMEEPRITKS